MSVSLLSCESDYESSTEPQLESESETERPPAMKVRTRRGMRPIISRVSPAKDIPPSDIWNDNISEPNLPLFTGKSGICGEILEDWTPIQYVEFMITNELIEMSLDQTNLYANHFLEREQDTITSSSRARNWKNVL